MAQPEAQRVSLFYCFVDLLIHAFGHDGLGGLVQLVSAAGAIADFLVSKTLACARVGVPGASWSKLLSVVGFEIFLSDGFVHSFALALWSLRWLNASNDSIFAIVSKFKRVFKHLAHPGGLIILIERIASVSSIFATFG